MDNKRDGVGTAFMVTQREAWKDRPLYRSECHIFEHRGNHILFDVPSGAFFQADGVVRDILDLCEGRSILDLLGLLRGRHTEKDILSAFKELHHAEILSHVPPEQPRPFSPPGRLEVVHLGLDITYDGLSGAHIFARNADCSPSEYMSEDVARRAIDLLMQESGRIRQCHVTFQGGEPLLNAQLVDRIIEYGLERAAALGKEIFFDISGNSRLLNEQIFARLMKQNASILVKLDEEQDGELPLFRGAGPYSLSSATLRDHIRRKGAPVHLKGSVDRAGLDLRDRLDSALTEYPTAQSVTLTFRPLPADDPASLDNESLPEALRSLEDMADYVRDHVLNGQSAWIGDFEDRMAQVFNRKISFYHCGAGTRYLTVAPDGKLYVCPGLVKNDDFSVGDVHTGIDRARQKEWIKSTHVEKFEACATCWARYLCGGGCRLNSALNSGNVETPDPKACDLIRRSYELAMSTCLHIASVDEGLLQSRYAEPA